MDLRGEHAGARRISSSGRPCGWPYDRLLARRPDRAEVSSAAALDAVLISMLVRLVESLPRVARSRILKDRWVGLPASSCVPRASLPLLRLAAVHLMSYRPPISSVGRIRTGQMDHPRLRSTACVGPLLAFLAGPLRARCSASRPGSRGEICLPIAISAVILVCLITPPGLREWRLTGQHRIVPGQYAGQPEHGIRQGGLTGPRGVETLVMKYRLRPWAILRRQCPRCGHADLPRPADDERGMPGLRPGLRPRPARLLHRGDVRQLRAGASPSSPC